MSGWLKRLFGAKYPAVVSTIDRAVTAFLTAFIGELVAKGLDLQHFGQIAYWQAALIAGVASALSIIKSALMIGVTGWPALGSLVSSNLRQQRNVTPTDAPVPLRPNAAVDTPLVPIPVPPPVYRGEHEAPEATA